jgi:Flp pilus assembly pilin Flp
VEYALLVSLIALTCVVALGYFQKETAESFSESASAIGTASS